MNEVGAGSVKAHLNPHPKERYELTFTIHDAPGPLESPKANIQYEVGNKECIPSDFFEGGKSRTPGFFVPIALTRINDTTYRGEVTLDLPIDADYFGLGVCHWLSWGAAIGFTAPSGTGFGASIGQKEIEAQGTVPTYLWKGDYSNPSTAGYDTSGIPYAEYAAAPDHTKYFYIDISSKRIEP